MPRVDLDLTVDIQQTPRAVQLRGMFDLPEAQKQTVDFHFDVPYDERPWQIGLIVGPSGAGKSSVARHLFGDAMIDGGYVWHPDKSLVDSFPSAMSIRDVTAALSSVGFSSPPAWLKPFRVLSNGEQFRATLARALADKRALVCVDEFTSVVDRTVAQIGSAAVSKAVRRSQKQFVAVTCHEDVCEWLQPDWVLEPHVGRFTWREKRQRPAIDLEIRRVHHSAWSLFAPHHYLTAELNHSATCFGAFLGARIVAFDAWLPFVGALKDERKARRGHRTVCLPDYQGVGIGRALFDTVASMWCSLGYRAFSRTAHPAEIASRTRGGNWRLTRHGFTAKDTGKQKSLAASRTTTRRAASFEWIGEAMELDAAESLAA